MENGTMDRWHAKFARHISIDQESLDFETASKTGSGAKINTR
jgi:hypothetical protein